MYVSTYVYVYIYICISLSLSLSITYAWILGVQHRGTRMGAILNRKPNTKLQKLQSIELQRRNQSIILY